MGEGFSAILGTYNTRDLDLKQDDKATFGPKTGFKFERKKREVCTCEAYMMSARIPPKYRDYCAHLLLDYQVCRYKNMPWVFKCAHEKHAYLNCEHEDYVIRMKEFERERRLREREVRVKKLMKNLH